MNEQSSRARSASTYLKGSKRLAIIHRWLQGIDDPEYDVLPTKKEGKYIVKKRTTPLTRQRLDTPSGVKKTTEQVEQQADDEDEQEVEQHEPEQEEQQQSDTEQQEPPPTIKPKPSPKHKPTIKPKSKPKPAIKSITTPSYDPTVNLEILEQLKLLGDEIRGKRERKEQKQLIKQVVEKQMRRQQTIPLSQQVEDEYYSEDNEPTQPIFKSRIRR